MIDLITDQPIDAEISNDQTVSGKIREPVGGICDGQGGQDGGGDRDALFQRRDD